MAVYWRCDRCGKPINKPIERTKLVVCEVYYDLCAACIDSLIAWVRHESVNPRVITT
jgi:hypothetical protein